MNNVKRSARLAEELVKIGIQSKKTISGAESCTGGLIAKEITDVAGSSSVFFGACVTYTNEIKMKLIGVPPSVIEAHTEVSYACAEAMAEGARRTFGTDVAYATTGYAGPGGGTEKDPVGTVYVAFRTADQTVSHRLSLPTTASRKEVREEASRFVLETLLKILSEKPETAYESK